MHVLLVGGSGLLGRRLIPHLLADDHKVTVSTRSSRRPEGLPGTVDTIQWDTRSPFPDKFEADAVVSLAGADMIGRRWTDDYKQEMRRSRIETNERLAAWGNAQETPLSVFFTASAVGIYGISPDGPVDEDAPHGDDFLAKLCEDWEAAAEQAADGTRVVQGRFGILMDPQGGAMGQMLWAFRLGLGGKISNGKQPFPWVHIDDCARAIATALKDDRYQGPINLVAPAADDNASFTRKLGKALHRPTPFVVPTFALKLVYDEAATVMTEGQQVVPKRLQEFGFHWLHPELQEALEHLLEHETAPHADERQVEATA